jgi:hypothetical protein
MPSRLLQPVRYLCKIVLAIDHSRLDGDVEVNVSVNTRMIVAEVRNAVIDFGLGPECQVS